MLTKAQITTLALLLLTPALPIQTAWSAKPPARPVLGVVRDTKIAVRDINGALREPLANGGQKATVLIFIAHDCPISNSYAPEINRICAAYAPKKIAFYIVHAESGLALAAAKKHAHDYGYTCPVVLDSKFQLTKDVGANVTPEAAIVAPDGKLLYRGRIDNKYMNFGQWRYAASKHDLRAALDAIVHNKPVPDPTTTAIGCFIPTDTTT